MARTNHPFAAAAAGLWQQINLAQLPKVQTEYKFDPERRWKLDFAWPSILLGLEYQGLFTRDKMQGGHQTLGGIQKDLEKLNGAQILGWDVLYFTATETQTGDALLTVEKYLVKRLERVHHARGTLSAGELEFAQYFFKNSRRLAV